MHARANILAHTDRDAARRNFSAAIELLEHSGERDSLRRVQIEMSIAGFDRDLAKLITLSERQRTILGPEHPLLAAGLLNLGFAQRRSNLDAEAAASIDRAIEIRRRAHGPNHPMMVPAVYHRSILDYKRGDFDAALAMLRSVELPEHARFGNHYREMLALVLCSRGDIDEGIAVAVELEEKAERTMWRRRAQRARAACLAFAGKLAAASKLMDGSASLYTVALALHRAGARELARAEVQRLIARGQDHAEVQALADAVAK